jgi:hypothetical protein
MRDRRARQGGYIPAEENRVHTGADNLQTGPMREYNDVMYGVCLCVRGDRKGTGVMCEKQASTP